MKTMDSRLVVMVMAGWLVAGALDASVIQAKSLTRNREAVVVTGSSMSGLYGRSVNSADATLSPNQLFVWAYDSGSGWRQVVFQIDEVNNTYPNSPPPDYYDCTTGAWKSRVGSGTNYFEADDAVWDLNDELVFMTAELGDRVSMDEWAPGASTAHVRYEIAVTDPLNTALKGWAYVFVHTVLPTWTTASYMTWTEGTNLLEARDYTLQYATSDANAMYFTTLAVTPALGGTGANLMAQQRLRTSVYYSGMGTNVSINESAMRTQFHLGCYSDNSEGDSPWLYKAGRVRVSRNYWTNPPEQWYYSGDHTWKPRHYNRYYPTFWHEDQYINHSCPNCAAEMNWYRDYLDHSNALVFNYYTSNGDAVVLNGSTETLATTPTWKWSQSSSIAGSFVKIFPTTYMGLDSPNVPQNYYLDDGSTNGEAGYYLNEPAKVSFHHNFYYFILPPEAANAGQTYWDWVNAPLTRAFASQAYVTPPDFTGIQTAVDLNGACVDQGVRITWNAVADWRDGCSSSCANRKYEIYRNGTKIFTETNAAAESYTDTVGTNGTSYNYGVEACGQTGTCTALGNTLAAMDYVAASPALGSTATTAVDHDGCAGDGIEISWAAPSDWKDNGSGSRRFDLFWDGDAYAAPIATDVISPSVYAAPVGEAHTFRVRATNGCDLYANYALSATATDRVGTDPTPPANPQVTVADISDCSPTGVSVSWTPVAPWGDNGEGTSRYDLYCSRDGFTSPIAPNAVSPTTVIPPDNAWTAYRVKATNGCALTFTYPDGGGSDGSTAPNFAGAQGAADSNGCAASTVVITWADVNGDGPEGWNDGGAGGGPRLYRVFRDGDPIGELPDGAVSFSDTPPAANTVYAYLVQALNMDGCYTAGAGTVPGTDYAAAAPTASPGQTDAIDITCDSGNGVTASWDAPADWGDHGLNTANRRFDLYFSGNNYSARIASVQGDVLSAGHNPSDNVPYRYRVTARNGCSQSLTYAPSAPVFDKTSCVPSCTLPIDDDFDSSDHFVKICYSTYGVNFWTKTAGVGNGGSAAWRASLAGGDQRSEYACLRMSSPLTVQWTQDVKLRFWSAVAMTANDAGIVEIWTDDVPQWRKITTLPYPAPNATVPAAMDDGTGSCATNAGTAAQPAFQGAVPGMFYEVRLDPNYVTPATTQINIGFRVASDNTNNGSTWTVDDVMIGYGIADGVWWWSLGGDLAAGVVKSGADEAVFSWEDGGLYTDDEFRIYRSGNPANMRTDATSSVVRHEPDTDAASYSWTTADGPPAPDTCWFYKVYGYREPCLESNQGEN